MSKQTLPPPTSENKGPLPGLISVAVVLVVLGLIIALLISRGTPTPTAVETQPTAAAAASAPTAAAASDGAATSDGAAANLIERADSYSAPPPMTIDPNKSYTATINTPRGEIVIQLRPDIAPMTVNNFVFLAREGFYDGLTWHRVIEGFMAQGGDPLGTGTGGPGYTVPQEFTNQILFDRPGIVATARRGDVTDSSGSQFFITTGAAPWLNEQYTIFGEVLEGQEIVNAIPLRDPALDATPGEEIISIAISES